MWILLLVVLVNGGVSPARFETHTYTTEQQCITAEHQFQNDHVYGYCTYKEPKP